LGGLVVVAGIISVEWGISAAVIEIMFGVFAGNALHIAPTAWLTFIASLGSILLTFLAGTEVDLKVLREKFVTSVTIGGLSFLVPFVLVFVFTYLVGHWSLEAAKIAGIALSTTSLAVVYAVLVETGLAQTELGKIMMAATFVTDLGTAIALSVLFLQFNVYTAIFIGVSALVIVFGQKIIRYFFERYKNKVIEPEIKLLFFVFFITMALAEAGKSHAVLPIFLLGLVMSTFFAQRHDLITKLRTIGFALITPFFFIRGGMNVGISDVIANVGLLAILLGVKLVAKLVSVYPLVNMFMQENGKRANIFFTLLMSTGLTFGTIASVFGYQAGYIDKPQFSVLVSVVILSAVVPTLIAQRFFAPLSELQKEQVLAELEEE
jgi:Kef-type K+ transport system membrane component KefB